MSFLPRWFRFGFLFLASGAFAQFTPPPAAPSSPPNLCEILRRMPPALIGYSSVLPNADGSASPDAASAEDPLFQLSGRMKLAIAAAHGDEAVAEDSWLGVDSIFAHQTKSGDLGKSPTVTAHILCELTRALLVIQQSPLAAHFKDRIEALKPQIAKTARWLTGQRGRMFWDDRAAPDRLLAEAEAFVFCGRLLDDPALVKFGQQFEDKALKLARPADSVFLETNGADTSFESACLVRLQEILPFFPDARLEDAVTKGTQWELAHVSADGTVRSDAKKPTFFGSKMLIGPEKQASVGEILLALLYYHERTANPAALTAAEHLHEHYALKH